MKTVSRHLKAETAHKRASQELIVAGKLAKSRSHSSGHAKRDFGVIKGFLHWKVVEK